MVTLVFRKLHCRESNCNSDTEGAEMKNNNRVSWADSEDDSDGEIVEENCEPAMVEGQICSIPYELYDLPDLKGILSIETWNSLMTDEERYFLSSFLPDMDQLTFNLTLEKLVGGSDLYFGNPMQRFYQKLRGGLYLPKVACCRDGLMFVKRKRYYYSLRSYHENMRWTFTDMRRLWDQYGKELSTNERLLLWSKRTQIRSARLPDLNRVPSEEMDPIKKHVETTRPDGDTFGNCNASSDILKVKVSKNIIFQNSSPNPVFGKHHHQSVPRGVLKAVSRPPSAGVDGPDDTSSNILLPTRATSSEILRDKTSTPFQASGYSGTIFQKLGGSKVNTIAELPKCVLNQQDTLGILLDTTQRSIRRAEKMESEPSANDSADARQQDLLRGVGVSNYFTNQEQYSPFRSRFPILKPKILGTGSARTTETTKDSSLRQRNSEIVGNIVRKPLGIPRERNERHDEKDDHKFSFTYKRRRKVQRIHVA